MNVEKSANTVPHKIVKYKKDLETENTTLMQSNKWICQVYFIPNDSGHDILVD